MQSIKSHLASEGFKSTTILGRRWALDDMIAAYLRQIRATASLELGARCVVGRPVRYWGARGEAGDVIGEPVVLRDDYAPAAPNPPPPAEAARPQPQAVQPAPSADAPPAAVW